MSDHPVMRPRPVSLAATQSATSSPVAPPVPRRRDSLPTPKNPFEGMSGTSSTSMSTVETSFDDPHTTHTFTAKSLWRDSFKTLHDFQQRDILCDVEIKVGDKCIRCHRVVLAVTSQYFKTMFTSQMAESSQSSVTIKDIEEAAMEQLISFAYTARITLSTDNVQSLLYASSILQIELVATACCEFMKSHLHPTNCIGIRTFAEQHGHGDLMKQADSFILAHYTSVVESDEFVTMPAKLLESFLSSSNLNVDCEMDVYESLMKWIRHDPTERAPSLPTFMAHIKLPLLPPTFLLNTVATDELLKRNLDCRDYLDEAKCYQLSLAQVVPGVKHSVRMRPRKSYAGVVFCVGGRGSSGDPFKTIECYDLRKNRWFPVAEMSTKRRHVGVVSVGGKLYAVGGHDGQEHLNTGELFDPKTNKWKPIAPMATLRRGIALACLGGPIYAVGGLDDSTCFNIVERYDPASNTWSSVASMNWPRGGVAVAALKGFLFSIGGNDGTASLDSCERYDPHLNKWTTVAAMNKRRAGAGVAELNGQLYVVGGFDDNSPLDSVEQYNPENNAWTLVARMSCPRGGVGVAALGGKLYAVGGHDGTNYLSTVEAYDPITNSWEKVANIGVCRAGAGISVVKCRLEQLKDISKVNMPAAADTTASPRKVCYVFKCNIYTRSKSTPSSNNQNGSDSSLPSDSVERLSIASDPAVAAEGTTGGPYERGAASSDSVLADKSIACQGSPRLGNSTKSSPEVTSPALKIRKGPGGTLQRFYIREKSDGGTTTTVSWSNSEETAASEAAGDVPCQDEEMEASLANNNLVSAAATAAAAAATAAASEDSNIANRNFLASMANSNNNGQQENNSVAPSPSTSSLAKLT